MLTLLNKILDSSAKVIYLNGGYDKVTPLIIEFHCLQIEQVKGSLSKLQSSH